MPIVSDRERRALGTCGISVPPIIFGTSALGNLYEKIPYEQKLGIAQQWFEHIGGSVCIDTAGKYGAGLALEVLGRVLEELRVPPDRVVISNKLGWKRVPIGPTGPTFEQGVWFDLEYDAVQWISYDGILACYDQGNELLGPAYHPQLVSVHDPDEFLAAAADAEDRRMRLRQVIGAYRALSELKHAGKVRGVGIGAKDWRVIREISDAIELDWVMLACSLTVFAHPPDLLEFVRTLADRNIGVINSAVFNSGFLTGGSYFDYRPVDPKRDAGLFAWRESFFQLCRRYEVVPANACVEFGLCVPGTVAVALNTANPARVRQNVESVLSRAPTRFWSEMKERKLISRHFHYLGDA